MEVIEIVSHFVNRDSNVLRVEFRCMGDELDEVRTDVIEYTYVEEFGYDSGLDYDEFFDEYEEDEWDYNDDDEEFMDEETLLSFLNEYYVVYPKLPDAEQL
jgi:hypothetical protein